MSFQFSKDVLNKYEVADWGYTEELEASTYDHYDSWVKEDGHGPLKYLADERKEKRKSLEQIFPEAKSAVSFLFSYSDFRKKLENFYQSEKSNGKRIASYALAYDGEDYHYFLRRALDELGAELQKEIPGLEYKICLDIQPVLERDLAYRCGLGWFGKNSMFIHKSHGSFMMIGSLILSEKLNQTVQIAENDHCGQCTACISACPTDAIDLTKRTIKSELCISTYTIELFKDNTEPPKGMENSRGEIFGCDICQDVCPWNKRVFRNNPTTELPNLSDTNNSIFNFFLKRPIKETKEELDTWSNGKFLREFKSSALERTGRIGWLKNLKFYLKDS